MAQDCEKGRWRRGDRLRACRSACGELGYERLLERAVVRGLDRESAAPLPRVQPRAGNNRDVVWGDSGMRVFAIVWAGQFVSLSGSGLTGFALGVWVYLTTGSVTQFSMILLATIIPGIIMSPFAGAHCLLLVV